jgi:hypothetical protein
MKGTDNTAGKSKKSKNIFKKIDFWVVVFLLLFTLINRAPLVPKVDTHVYFTEFDFALYTWELAWNCRTVETMQLPGYWKSNAMHPYPYAFCFSENMMGLTPFALPVWLLWHNPVLMMNIVSLLMMFLTAVCTYFVLKKMIGYWYAGFAGALIFAFYPYLSWSFTIGHPHILSLMWVPIVVYANWMFWKEGKLRYLLLAGFFLLWTFLISIYLGVFLTVFIGIWTVIWFFYERKLFDLKKIARWAIIIFLVWAFMIPIFLVYNEAKSDMGVIRTLEQQLRFTGPIWTWFSVPDDNWLWGQQLKVLPPSGLLSREDAMFPGIIALIFFILSFFIKDMPKWLKSLRLTAMILAVFAMGPFTVGIGKRLPLPFLLFYYLFPPLWATRNPHRWALFVVFVMALLAAFIIKKYFTKKSKWTVALKFLLIAGILLETFSFIQPREGMHPRNAQVFKELKDDKVQHTVVEVPMGRMWVQWGWETKPLLNSTYHWNRVINGCSGLWPPAQYQLGREMREFPSKHTIKLLQAMEVDRIVIHERMFNKQRKELLKKLKLHNEITFIKRVGRSSIWALKKGALRTDLNFDTDFEIMGPSKIVEGPVTLSLRVIPAQSKDIVLFNNKAPAEWKFPISDPWLINVSTDLNNEKRESSYEWRTPGLFHIRNQYKPFLAHADQKEGSQSFQVELNAMGYSIPLKKVFKVMPSNKAHALKPYLRLPMGHDLIPSDQLKADFKAFIPTPASSSGAPNSLLKPRMVIEGDVQVLNPGPLYWLAHEHKGVFMEISLINNNDTVKKYRFKLPHDLFPGDSAMVHFQVPIPKDFENCKVYVNCAGRLAERMYDSFPEFNKTLIWDIQNQLPIHNSETPTSTFPALYDGSQSRETEIDNK